MRFNFQLSPGNKIIPFNYQQLLVGVFHKWMGWNKIHDEISLYSLSWLKGGTIQKIGYDFSKGGTWFISFWEKQLGQKLMQGIMNNPDLFYGLRVVDVTIQEEPQFSEKEWFSVASPILIRKYSEKKVSTHLTYKDEDADKYLTETLKKKLSVANMDTDISVSFDKDYSSAKTKLVTINDIKSKTSMCPVVIKGNPESIQFAWNVGLGHSTGCAFGALN